MRTRLETWQQFDPNRKNNNAPNLVTPTPNHDVEVIVELTPEPEVVDTTDDVPTPLIDQLLEETPKPKKVKK